MELNPTSCAILGMLGKRPMSGYEIKQFVDHSTRFFWAASYGQIYPELRRLADGGLITGEAVPHGGRKRKVFSLTAAGAKALRQWLAAPPQIQEMRDESLLKIFFSDFGGTETTLTALEYKRAHHESVAERLRAIQSSKAADSESSIASSLRFGIALNEFIAGWCEGETKRLHKSAKPTNEKGTA